MQNRAIIWLLLDDDDDDSLELTHILSKKKRKKVHELFARRRLEGAFSILIERYLFSDIEKFTSFLRVGRRVFYIILKYIYQDIYSSPCNRVPNPIDPSQKLCIALRYSIHYSFQSFSVCSSLILSRHNFFCIFL